MDDIEKHRVDYVARIEAQLAHQNNELAKYRAIAEKWEPVCHAEASSNEQLVRFTLAFGGKRSTAGVTYEGLAQSDVPTIVSAIVQSLIESNVAERLREAVQPEVERLKPSMTAILGAGKW